MDIKLFAQIGEAAFGRTWQVQMSEHLGVHYRSVSRWVQKGKLPIDLTPQLRQLVQSRITDLTEVRRSLWSERSK